MKVLHVLDTSVPDTAGYTTRGYYLVNEQKKLGVEPIVLTSERYKGSYSENEEIEGVKYWRTLKKQNLVRKLPVFAECDEIKNLRKRVFEVADKEKVNLIHAHSPSLLASACLPYCRAKNIPLIYEIRAFWEDAAVDRGAFRENSFRYRLRKFHETLVVKKVDAVIAICSGIKNDLMGRGISESKIHIVGNGVDYEKFHPIPVNNELKKKLRLDGKVVIGFIGSFFNFEGLHDLVLAMKQISASNPDIVLLLVGTGQTFEDLKNLAKSENLEDNVILTGRVPHEQVSAYYSIIDLLVYPRIKKRITDLVTPLKPLEAMAMEKPVLMSDVGGLIELVNVDGVAGIFKAGDQKDLAGKCLSMCADKDTRINIGQKARQNIIKNWGWNHRAEQDVEIYDQLLHKSRRK